MGTALLILEHQIRMGIKERKRKRREPITTGQLNDEAIKSGHTVRKGVLDSVRKYYIRPRMMRHIYKHLLNTTVASTRSPGDTSPDKMAEREYGEEAKSMP